MNKPKIYLNDFESFDRYLFGDENANWSKFYHFREHYSWMFTPPILWPVNEVEYQLDHYTLWMTIAYNNPLLKPIFDDVSTEPFCRCYACSYKLRRYGANGKCVPHCPLTCAEKGNCVKIYREWSDTHDKEYASRLAIDIARIPWK